MRKETKKIKEETPSGVNKQKETRFIAKTSEEIDELLNKANPKSMQKATKYGVAVFKINCFYV